MFKGNDIQSNSGERKKSRSALSAKAMMFYSHKRSNTCT